MEKKLTAEEMLRAADLKSQGWKLSQIQAAINPDASMMVFSRAITEVREAFARIEHYRQTGDASGLSCVEAVIALQAWQKPPAEDGGERNE